MLPCVGITSTSLVKSGVYRWCRASSVHSFSTQHVQLPKPRPRSRSTNSSSTDKGWTSSGANLKDCNKFQSTRRIIWMVEVWSQFLDFLVVRVSHLFCTHFKGHFPGEPCPQWMLKRVFLPVGCPSSHPGPPGIPVLEVKNSPRLESKWKYPLYVPRVSVNLSKSLFIYQLLINPSSKAFDSDQIRSLEFPNEVR